MLKSIGNIKHPACTLLHRRNPLTNGTPTRTIPDTHEKYTPQRIWIYKIGNRSSCVGLESNRNENQGRRTEEDVFWKFQSLLLSSRYKGDDFITWCEKFSSKLASILQRQSNNAVTLYGKWDDFNQSGQRRLSSVGFAMKKNKGRNNSSQCVLV